MKRTIETKFYGFKQANSGGSFEIYPERGIGPRVWIEALNQNDAVNRAIDIGLYFNGVDIGRDCECCGDRWSTWCDEEDLPHIQERYAFMWHDTVYVHMLDGEIKKITKAMCEQEQVSGIKYLPEEKKERVK